MIKKLFKKEWLSTFDNIEHFSNYNRIKKESLTSHSYKVTLFSILITEECFLEYSFTLSEKNEIMLFSIFHDFDEIFLLRDLDHHLKYNSFNGKELRDVLDKFVEHSVNKELIDSPFQKKVSDIICKKDLSDLTKKVVKLSDWLSMFLYCKVEISMGNNVFVVPENYIKGKIFEHLESMRGYVSSHGFDVNYFNDILE